MATNSVLNVINTKKTPAIFDNQVATKSEKKPVSDVAVATLDQSLTPVVKLGMRDKIIKKIETIESKIDRCRWLSPLMFFQLKIDFWVKQIEADLNSSKLAKFSAWLDRTGKKDEIVRSLALFLVKLPLKAARNILRSIIGVFKAVGYSLVHPIKALTKLAKLIVIMLDELRKPETWTKIGAGMMGAGLGQACVGNPLSVLSVIIGAALSFTGFTVGALVATVKAYNDHKSKGSQEAWIVAKNAAVNNMHNQSAAFSESMMTGFLMGLLIGGVQKAVRDKELAKQQQIENERAIREKQWVFDRAKKRLQIEFDERMADFNAHKQQYAQDFAKKVTDTYKLPPAEASIDTQNNIRLIWHGKDVNTIVKSRYAGLGPKVRQWVDTSEINNESSKLTFFIHPDGRNKMAFQLHYLHKEPEHFVTTNYYLPDVETHMWKTTSVTKTVPAREFLDMEYQEWGSGIPQLETPLNKITMMKDVEILEGLKDIGIPNQVPVIPVVDSITPIAVGGLATSQS